MSDTDRIARANDLLRQTFLTGKVILSAGISSLPDDTREEIITKVRCFDAFGEDNDPYGEHDFGAFDQDGVGKVFWKIDAYDPTLTMGSADPADPTLTRRVLTILLAEEY